MGGNTGETKLSSGLSQKHGWVRTGNWVPGAVNGGGPERRHQDWAQGHRARAQGQERKVTNA